MIEDIIKFMYIVNNDIIKPSDCIVLLEGDGYNRVDKTIELYKNNYSNKVIFSGGFDNINSGAYNINYILPCLQKSINNSDIIIESNSLNTKEQGNEIMKLVKINNWKRILLVASGYHQYRVYLTFLKCMLDNNLLIEIINTPVTNQLLFEENKWGKRIDLITDEFNKIKQYTDKGDLVNLEYMFEYQLWKENQN